MQLLQIAQCGNIKMHSTFDDISRNRFTVRFVCMLRLKVSQLSKISRNVCRESRKCKNSDFPHSVAKKPNFSMVHRPSTVFPLLLWILDVSVANFTPFYFLKPRYYVVVLQRFRFGQNDSTKSHFHVISRKITHKFFNYELATLQIAPYFPPKVKSWDLSYLHSRGCNCAKEQRQYRKSFTIRL